MESAILGAQFCIGAYLMFMFLVSATNLIEDWVDRRRKRNGL